MPRSRSTPSRATRPSRPRSASAPTAVRIHEAVGASTESWDAAVIDAVRGAKDDAPDPIAVEVGRLWADLDARQRIQRYRASVRIAYRQAVVAPSAPSVGSVDMGRSRDARSRSRVRSRRA